MLGVTVIVKREKCNLKNNEKKFNPSKSVFVQFRLRAILCARANLTATNNKHILIIKKARILINKLSPFFF